MTIRKLTTIAAIVIAAIVAGVTLLAMRARLAGAPAATTQPDTTSTSAPRSDRAPITIDTRRQQLIGVRLASVERAPLASDVRAVGLVRYDETRLADINMKIEGWIRDLRVDYTGQFVRRGDPLFTFYSPELMATQQEYLLALKTRARMQPSQVADARAYADRLVEASRRRMALWDLPAEHIARLEQSEMPPADVTFRSPVSGYVIEKQALRGLHVTPGQSLYRVADLSVVWIEADVYERDMAAVRVGARATVTLDAYPGDTVAGRVVYLYPAVDEKTRAMKVRLALPNHGLRLKPGMYANVAIATPARTGLRVPANAVLDSGAQQVLFVSQGDGHFEPRVVKVGPRSAEAIEVLDGVKEGEQVATSAAFLLDSESQLRAALQDFAAPPASTSASAGARPSSQAAISFRSDPSPPRAGINTFEVTVKDASGQPVADAEVSVTFYMAPMPAMNMPAMRNEVKLASVGGGVYRGEGQVLMGGTWEVTVAVSRGGQRIASQQLSVMTR